MKKYILSVICLLALSVSYLQASGGPSFSQYKDIDSYGVDISTIQFSTIPVRAFLGTGLVYGVFSSSCSLQQYYDLFDTTGVPLTPAWTDPNWKMRVNLSTNSAQGLLYNQSFERPLRFKKGCWWQGSDAKVNSTGLLYLELP